MSQNKYLLGLLLCTLRLGAQQSNLGRPPLAAANTGSKANAAMTASGPASWFDTSSRSNVQNIYVNLFTAFQNVPYGWTGNVSSCAAGTLSQDYLDAAALRFNLFRGISGVPAGIVLDAVNNDPPEQQAALMMSANGQLSHTPQRLGPATPRQELQRRVNRICATTSITRMIRPASPNIWTMEATRKWDIADGLFIRRR